MSETTALTVIAETDRRRWLGGSDVAAVLGLSRYRTPYDVYLAKTATEPGEMDPARKLWLERRKRWEPVVVQMLREELDAEIVATNLRYSDAEHPFMAAEIDAEAREESGEIVNVEIKTVSPFVYGERAGWGEAGTGDIPIEYEAQVQHGLAVTQRRVCIVAAMVGLDSMQFYRVERDDALLAEVRSRLVMFWNEYVLALKAPPPQTLHDVERMFRTPKADLAVEASGQLAIKALRARAINGQIDALGLEYEALEYELKLAMGAAETMSVDGRKLVSWREKNWSRVDVEAMKRDRIYSKYLLTGKRREFRVLKGD